METYEYFSIALGIIIAIFVVWLFFIHEPLNPEFCIFDQKSYLLTCVQNNQTIGVVVNEKNLEIAMKKNNCTIVQETPEIKLDYCNNSINITQYIIKGLKPL